MTNPRHFWLRLLVLVEVYVITSIASVFIVITMIGIQPSEWGETRLSWVWYALVTGALPVLAGLGDETLPWVMSLLLMAPLLLPILFGMCYMREKGPEWYVWLLLYAGSWLLICGIGSALLFGYSG